MKLSYDPEANAVYVMFNEATVARSRGVRKNRSDAGVDYAADGSIVGVELLGVRQGVDITGLPYAEEIAALLREFGFAVGRNAPDFMDGENLPAAR